MRIDASFSPVKPSCVHRFLISGPNLGIDAKKPSRTAQRLHRFLFSSPDLRIDAAPSLLQLRTARLQHHRSCTEEQPACRMTVADAGGTGCHEGGIILSKKPPEWYLSPLQQRSASDSILRCRKDTKKTQRKHFHCGFVVVSPGIEPGTQGFSVLCSTN